MDTSLATTYLGILLVLLAGAAFFVLRQVWRTRRVETTLSRLQKQANSPEATPAVHYALGSLFLDKKMFGQAIQEFQKALKDKDEMEPDHLSLVYNALGYGYVSQEQYDLAIRFYKDALKLVPDYSTAWNNLGFAYEKKQLVAPALEAYGETLKLEPNNETAKRRTAALSKRVVTSA